ncbi:MAG TPA: AMP-binding protein [Pyrinomonadaceae bacterium]|nr:AMP-binding protein [Pyrinomonadaceae bacterium]
MSLTILKNLVNPVRAYVERETLISFLDDCIAHGDETAVAHWRGLRTARWSYARLASAAFQFARELEAREIGRGDRVLVWGENSPEWIAAFYGCLLRGAVVVPLDLKSATDFVERVQQQVSAKLLLADNEQPQLQLPRLALNTLEDRIARHSNQRYSSVEVKPDDLVEIVFTSGTTAEPKGVCLTHRNLLANLAPIEKEFKKYARWERLVHPLRFLCLLPLSHVFGQLMGIFIPQFLAAEIYFRESYKPSEIVAAVKKDRINVVVTVPRVLETLREKVKTDAQILDDQLSAAERRHFLRNWWTFRKVHRQFGWRLWAFISGGATLESETETFWRRVGYAIIQGYGMTETASLTSLSHPFRIRQGSIGKPVAGQEVKLSDEGEILVRGNNVSPGYWNRNGQSLADEQGWIHTGDIGEIGPDGNIYFRGRSKETIVTASGLKIYPSDLEAALDHQPEIKASAVIPLTGGTEALAVLIPRDQSSDLSAAVQRANDSLAEFQRIRHWVVWPKNDFPRTTGTRKVIKVQVAEAVKPLLNQSVKATIPAEDTMAPLSLPVISRIAKVQSGGLSLSANLSDDLKLDSLGRVELLSALEDQYQIELDEAAITEATTLGDIEQIVSRGKAESLPYPYPAWAMRFPMTLIRPVVYHLFLLPLTLIMCRARVIGDERLAKLNVAKPVLFIANHITDVDAGLILSALPWRWRLRLAIAMSGEYLRDWRYPPANLGFLARAKAKLAYALGAALFNVFSLPRQSGFRQSFTYAGDAVDRGWSILIFPEGQETKDGHMQPFKAGIGLLASELNVAVVPIKLDGLFELKKRRQYFVRPGTVSITFGDPIEFPRNHTPAEITDALEVTLKSL